MSDRDCPDDKAVEWLDSRVRMGHYVLTRDELNERIDEAQRDAYAEGRKDEREECMRLLNWAYIKLTRFCFSKQDDALMLDEIKLMQMESE